MIRKRKMSATKGIDGMKLKSLAKKGLLVFGMIVVVLAVLIVIIIKTSSYEIVAPDRSPGIPADHEWYGGVDGGDWIRCEPQNELKEFLCSVYSESGTFSSKGLYIPSRPILPPYALSSGGGGFIYLKDQQEADLVTLKADGWFETSEGKTLYKDGERVDDP